MRSHFAIHKVTVAVIGAIGALQPFSAFAAPVQEAVVSTRATGLRTPSNMSYERRAVTMSYPYPETDEIDVRERHSWFIIFYEIPREEATAFSEQATAYMASGQTKDDAKANFKAGIIPEEV